MATTKEKYPTWIYQNFKNFTRFFRLSENALRNIFWPQAKNKKTSHENIILSRRDNVVTIVNIRTGRIGVAKCHKEDNFDIVTGIAIAWARYCAKDEQQLAEIDKTIAQLNYDRLDNIPNYTYVCTVSERVYFTIGTNPLKTDYIIGIDGYTGLPLNLPKNLAVRTLQEKA